MFNNAVNTAGQTAKKRCKNQAIDSNIFGREMYVFFSFLKKCIYFLNDYNWYKI